MSNDSEFHKLKDWINKILTVPFNETKNIIFNNDIITCNNINKIMLDIKNSLDKEIYGMNQIKEELLIILNHKINNPNSSEHSIALIGPPGIGKTKLIRTFANILNIPFVQISMGGINDSSFLEGHSYTYESARPGKIVESLIKMKSNAGILFFDEIDKISNSSKGIEVSNQLLHITDFTQNSSFTDNYFSELPIDLSKIWFIFSLNDEKLLDPILKNRMNLIFLSEYNCNDKIEIINNFLIPNICSSLKFDSSFVIINNDIKKYIINTYSKEPGIRSLKRVINIIYSKLQVLYQSLNTDMIFSFSIQNFKIPHTLTINNVDMFLKNYLCNENNNNLHLYI